MMRESIEYTAVTPGIPRQGLHWIVSMRQFRGDIKETIPSELPDTL